MWLPDVAMLSVGASQDLCLDVQRPPTPPHFMVPRLKLRALHILRKRSTTEPHPQSAETSSIAFLLVLSKSDVRRLG